MKKEILIYLTILIFASSLMHFEEFTSHFFQHIINLKTAGAYGLTYFHPFVFTFIIYIIILLTRIVIKKIFTYKINKK
ncbi:hypothetical protein CRU99_09780 [Malaciobacter mytili]|uniref:hypothetical protein n=1 Tax=Malaciobacter mytili TaxID=603050 RepID=UPI00100C088A|nr:hypothetical protein [Malaciobacter mytili]RXI41413.1 hypothetical protein CRU99_09780 [Malaciobacter mytili]